MSTKSIPAKVSLYNIVEQGLFQRNVEEPIFSDLEVFLDDLIKWVTLGDKPLR